MHTLMAREHNRLAHGLAQINPHWDDETLYQEARRIVIAEIQHITYNEFLPIILGKEVMEKFGLLTQKEVRIPYGGEGREGTNKLKFHANVFSLIPIGLLGRLRSER